MLTLNGVFRKELTAYRRDFGFLPNYIKQMGKLLSVKYQQPLAMCIDFVAGEVKEATKEKKKVRFVRRNKETGDREKAVSNVDEYISYVVNSEKILSPTLTVYDSKRQRKSILSEAVQSWFQQRKVYKKKMFFAMANNEGDDVVDFFDQGQGAEKTTANSLSGGQATQGTILTQQTAHPALTSNCRLSTTLTNAFVEKFLAGNRHYSSLDNIYQNIVSIITITDMELVNNAIMMYQLHVPTAEECLMAITRSSHYYFPMSQEEASTLLAFLGNMSACERTAFAYVGDLATLAKYNHHLVYHFLTGLMKKDPQSTISKEEGVAYIENMDGFYHVFYNSLVFNRLVGEKGEDRLAYMKENADRFGCLIKEHYEHIHRHQTLIDAFFCTLNLPADVWNFPNSSREVAIVSDTDSGIFTTQEWAKWLEGKYIINENTDSLRDVLTFLVTKLVQHNLAIVSSNLGIAHEDYDFYEMKNEYGFRVVGITTQGKHYIASQDVREGNVFVTPHLEIKGKELVASDKSAEVNELKKWMIETIFEQMRQNCEVDIVPIMDKIVEMEREIDTMLSNPPKHKLHPIDINIQAAYKNGKGAYQYHEMWEEIFVPLGYPTQPPPYRAYKISSGVKTASDMNDFLEAITDVKAKQSIEAFMERSGRKQIGTWVIPEVAMDAGGVPKSLLSGIDRRKMISSAMNPIYMLLETLGFFYRFKDTPRLVMDEWGSSDEIREAEYV